MKKYVERNIEVFKESRILASTKYKAETDSLVEQTKVYRQPLDLISESKRNVSACNIGFDRCDTVYSILSGIQHGYNVCALNFADAITPGGLVFQGAFTQEECLCRCSNLYESLVKPECIEDYYKYNASLGNSIFSDRVIYSKGVSILRESFQYFLLDEIVKCDIVTCPAPIFGAFSDVGHYYNVILNRIKGILKVVEDNGADAVILGAWGCGAFGGDARLVGRAFAEALKEFNCFDAVVFSVKSSEASPFGNFELLKSGFEEGSRR